MNLIDIKEKMAHLPTMIGLKEEKPIIEDIMSINPQSVKPDIQILSDIMSDLLVSRSTSFYEFTEADKSFFESFANWLVTASKLFEGGRKAELIDLARIYSTFPDNVTGDK